MFTDKSPDACIKIIDFGISRKFTSTKLMKKRIGTVYYMAPEIWKKGYNEKCDIWACGIILYILLCGYPPFSGSNNDELVSKIKLGKYRFLGTINIIILLFLFKECDW